MTITNFEIQLTNCNNSYFAGQIVSGNVVVDVQERPKAIHGIKLKLQGKAKTHWKEATSNPRGAMTQYSDEESYIQEKVYLCGYDDNSQGNTYSLPTGHHSYPFSFTLPPSLPSSLTHKYGQVKYYLEATISRGQGLTKPNYTCRLPFTVNAILDLNNEYGAQHECVTSKEKNVCCFCCKSGPVGFDFKIFKSGYVPGEVVKFHAELYNYSTREVSTVVDLVQDLKFHAMGRSKSRSTKVLSLQGYTLKPNETKEWKSEDRDHESLIRIPAVPPSRLEGCRIIEVSYFIKVKMDVKDAVTLKDYIPITIGTIPLRENFDELRGELPNGQIEVTVASDLTSVILFPTYPDLPLPTYEEAIALTCGEPLDLDDEDSPPEYMSIVKFIPRYATYSPRLLHGNNASTSASTPK